MIKKTAEIDHILAGLSAAIDAHYQWMVNMFRCVVAAGSHEQDIINDHSHKVCRFGIWLDEQAPPDNDESPYVRLIDSAHQNMHAHGRELMLAIREKRWSSAHFDHFQTALLSFTSALTDYKIYLLTIRGNMDILTGLPGRRVLDESFDHQLRNASPFNLYLLLLDIDRFKSVNDTYGHLTGDVVLHTLATNLSEWTREYETVYRYGGEEFVVTIKAMSDEEACRVGTRLCQRVARQAIAYPGGKLNITVTGGISRAAAGEALDVVLGRADRAMYKGKQTGRNRCMFIDEQQVITLADTVSSPPFNVH